MTGTVRNGPSAVQIIAMRRENISNNGLSAKVSVNINERNTELLVDTGAAVTIISTDVFRSIPEENRPKLEQCKNVKLEAADGNQISVNGRASVNICIGNQCFQWTVYVAPITDDGLLGYDFLYHYECVFDTRRGLCVKGQWTTCDMGQEHHRVARVNVRKTTIIPARTECVIQAKGDFAGFESRECIVEPRTVRLDEINSDDNLEDMGLVIGCSLVDTHRVDIGIPVRVMNPTSEDIVIHEGTTIGTASEIEAVERIADEENSSQEHHERVVHVCKVNSDVQGADAKKCDRSTWSSNLTELYSRCSNDLTSNQRDELANLLEKHEAVFANSSTDYGRTSVIEHTIDTGDARPVRQPPRRPPKAFEKEEEKVIAEQLKNNIITESTSPWSSPLVYVKKKSGETRPCVDYRRVNDLTTKDAYPLPRIDDCLDCLGDARIFSTLDLQSGYWQIRVREEDRQKTAFVTRSGLYEYVTMPFGLTGAPATFMRCMEMIFRGVQWKTLLIYMDDIIIYSSDFDSHLERLDEALTRLGGAGLKLKPSKCHLLKQEVEFLGHVVTPEGVKTNPSKIEAVKKWPQPTNVSQVRSFLGLCSYYRRFIKSFSTIASPLNQLLNADQEFRWTSDCECAFARLKDILTSEQVMAYPNDTGVFILDTDASNTGIGAVLSQMQWNEERQKEEERPVAYASKSLTRTQRRYCVTRRELLAIVTFVWQFRPYLLGRKFVIRTDHSALRWIMSFREPENQMARWIELLSQFDFKIEHRPGKNHGNCDSLSRVPCDPECKCYDGQAILEELPCGGCETCQRKHKSWSTFMEVDNVIPLKSVKYEVIISESQPQGEPFDSDTAKQPADITCAADCCIPAIHGHAGPCITVSMVSVCKQTSDPELSSQSETTVLENQCFVCATGAVKHMCLSFYNKPCEAQQGDTLDECANSQRLEISVRAVKPANTTTTCTDETVDGDNITHGRHRVQATWAKDYTDSDLIKMQKDDTDLKPVMQWMDESTDRPHRERVQSLSKATRNLWLLWDQLTLVNGVLYKRWVGSDATSSYLQLVVPQCLQDKVLHSLHNTVTSGHLGIKKTLSKVKRSFYWYGQKMCVRNWIMKCKVCGARKPPAKTPRAPLKEYRSGAPLDRLCIDILGPLPVSDKGNRYVLVVGDSFTRWIEAYALPDQTAQSIAHVLVYEFFSRFGPSLELHSDQGRAFESELFQQICRLLEIHKTRSSPYHPSSNGKIERFNKVLVNMISAYLDEEQRQWDIHLPLLTSAYRACLHEATGYSPNYLMLGREVYSPINMEIGVVTSVPDDGEATNEHDYVAEFRQRQEKIHALVRDNLAKSRQRQKRDHDVRLSYNSYKVGDYVYVMDTARKKGKSPKLNPNKYLGPCVVTMKYSDLLFEIAAQKTGKRRVLHHNRLKPYLSDSVPEWATLLRKKLQQPSPNNVTQKKATTIDANLRRSPRNRQAPARFGL